MDIETLILDLLIRLVGGPFNYVLISIFVLPISALYQLYRLTK